MIDKLEFLLALSQERHFGRAAEVCGVTQQTLSAGLKQLEGQLGALLVQRGSRFQGFTTEGEGVLVWARRIVGDARAMQQELAAARRGLEGHLRLATIPTSLPMVAALTTPYRARHPGVRLSVRSAPSTAILAMLENLEVDAGLTYLDNEPLGRVAIVPLYHERYCLLTAPGGPFAERTEVSWAEAGSVPLCLLTPDMQNRRIIDQHLRVAGVVPSASLESNSMLLLVTHVRTGQWASIMPAAVAGAAAPNGLVQAIPIIDPGQGHSVGLVASPRDPMLPTVDALFALARAMPADRELLLRDGIA